MSAPRRRILHRSALARWTGAVLVAAVLVPVGARQAAAATALYAAPNGSGTSCTAAAPCSLSVAQQQVRALAPTMSGDITVDLRGGTYQLASTLAFTPADSGANGHKVVWQAYPGEQPVFTGGRRVSGWQLYDSGKGVYRASVPTGTQSRQLFVNGVRAERARSALNPGCHGPSVHGCHGPSVHGCHSPAVHGCCASTTMVIRPVSTS